MPTTQVNPMLLVLTPGGTVTNSNVGPLIVCPTNNRYMATPDGHALLLAGSAVWNNSGQRYTAYGTYNGSNPNPSGPYTTLTFQEFLARNSTYEAANWTRYMVATSPSWPGKEMIPDADLPFVRTGPGLAADGGLKWDLTTFNQTFFNNMRANLQSAANNSPPFYCQVELWAQGSSLMNADSPWLSANNINGCNPNPVGQLFQVQSGTIWNMMFGYMQKWMDTCFDLPNVVWDISGNELSGDQTTFSWLVFAMNQMRSYEAGKSYMKHPFILCSSNGNNGAYNGDQSLWGSTAEMVCPGWGDTVTSGLLGSSSFTGYNIASPPSGNIVGQIDNAHTSAGWVSPDQLFCAVMRGWGSFNFFDIEDDTLTTSPVSTAQPLNQYESPAFGTSYNQTDYPLDTAHVQDRVLTRQAIWAAQTALKSLTALENMNPVTTTAAGVVSASTTRCLVSNDESEIVVYQPTLGSQFTANLPSGFKWTVTWYDANQQAVIQGSAVSS